MKIVGTFSIVEGMIKTPPGIEGDFVLELNKNGSFIYHPLKTSNKELAFEVYDENEVLYMSFPTEAKATEYKLAMEKSCGRPFRMKKVFSSAEKNGKIVLEE